MRFCPSAVVQLAEPDYCQMALFVATSRVPTGVRDSVGRPVRDSSAHVHAPSAFHLRRWRACNGTSQ
eukprot:12776352-Alexandrium_andersonii.AAC.1